MIKQLFELSERPSYMHSCLKTFSIWQKAMFKQQNRCTNHEIHVLFEHDFCLKSVDVIGQCVSVFLRNKMADAHEILWFLVNFYVVNIIFQQDIKLNSCENTRILIKHAYFNASQKHVRVMYTPLNPTFI